VTLSTRLIVMFIAIILCGAAGGQNDQHQMPRPPYCVIVPAKTMAEVYELLRGAEVYELLRGAKEDMQWPDLKDTKHLDRAMERIEQADNWLHSVPADTCPAGTGHAGGGL